MYKDTVGRRSEWEQKVNGHLHLGRNLNLCGTEMSADSRIRQDLVVGGDGNVVYALLLISCRSTLATALYQ